VIFNKTHGGFNAVCPDIPGLSISAPTLKEAELIVEKTIDGYINKGAKLVSDYEISLEADKAWRDVVEPAVKEMRHIAAKNGCTVDSCVNSRVFNQINRFNRSCSIRTVMPDDSVRKLTIGWRVGSDNCSYGNSLTTAGWKSVRNSVLNYDSLIEELAQRLFI
jgi:hypothetical protein